MKKIGLALMFLYIMVILTGCSCKHENTSLVNVIEAGCEQEGYSGDLYCNDCQETLEFGTITAALEHIPGELYNSIAPTCTTAGETGSIFCTVCGEELEMSEEIPATGHVSGELDNPIEPTCTTAGQTGSVFCIICGEELEMSEEIPATGHVPGELYNPIEPTCTTAGQTGSIFCTVCGEQLKMSEEIAATGHMLGELYNVVEASCIHEGYTGDAQCSVCGEIISGEVIPKAAHQFVDNVCQICEWRVPGMYVNDHLEITWDQLVNAGYIKVNNNTVTYVADSITGLLVIDESITHIRQMHGNTHPADGPLDHLDSVYLPQMLQEISNYAFERSSIQSVRFFGNQLTRIGTYAFLNSERLNNVIWPETVTEISQGIFEGCISLSDISIPDTVTAIGNRAFRNCSALTSIELPASLLTIEGSAFAGCGLESIVIPDGVILDDYASGIFQDCVNLSEIDLSNCTVANGIISDTFSGCTSLKSVKFPSGITRINNALYDCIALEELIIPEGVAQFEQYVDRYVKEGERNGALIGVKRVVWPTTLTDGSELVEAAPNLKEIYYTGSEALWNLTASKNQFTDVCYEFNYSYGAPFTNKDFKSAREIEAEIQAEAAIAEAQDLAEATIYEVTGFQQMKIAISLDENNNIKLFKVVEANETPGFGADLINAGFDALVGQHISSAQIDVKSGVTMTSNGINNALKAAAESVAPIFKNDVAFGSTDSHNTEVYEVKGFQAMKVAISVDDAGKIVSVSVIEHNETPGFGADLIAGGFDALLGQDIATAKIDVKSGVTLTSKGINEALKAAAIATPAAETDTKPVTTVYDVTGFQPMKVAIGVDEAGKIMSVNVTEHNETPGFGADLISVGFDALVGQDIATAAFDVKSGVTMTSNGINNALKAAAAATPTIESAPAEETIAESAATLYDVKGFQAMKVAIAVDDAGKIVSVNVTEHNETPGFGADLIDAGFDDLVGQDIETAQIDVKSGVTLTSKGINDALKCAASSASKNDHVKFVELTHQAVALRSRASSSGTIITRISGNAHLQVLAEEIDGAYTWYLVNYNGKDGYIRSDMTRSIE